VTYTYSLPGAKSKERRRQTGEEVDRTESLRKLILMQGTWFSISLISGALRTPLAKISLCLRKWWSLTKKTDMYLTL